MKWSYSQLNDIEEAIIKLSETTNLPEVEILEVIEDGFEIKYQGNLPNNIRNLIDELRSTFDVY